MKIKRAITYIRISADKQSNYSIAGQQMQTAQWCERNKVELIDTFTDEGYSARTFERPDMILLNAFVEKHYRTVDYLVVFDFTRFSRDTGEALVTVKMLQKKYGIKIVSAGENVIVDCEDPGSFFYAGLRFLQGEDEINRNRARVNLGIYTAKKKEGRYISTAPVGYRKTKDGSKTIIVIDEERAPMVRYIYEAYLSNVPVYEIFKKAREMGMKHSGHTIIQQILKTPTYTGLIHVKAYKDNPEELVEGIHAPIIDRTTWQQVQDKISGKTSKPLQIVSDAFPLRSVLLCHCGKPLTGAPSRGKSGRYFPYYKCKITGHNNINANRAHEQLIEIFNYLSLPEKLISVIKSTSEQLMEVRLKQTAADFKRKSRELSEVEADQRSIEEKYIRNHLDFETYQRWHKEYSAKKMVLKAHLSQLSATDAKAWESVNTHLYKLADFGMIYKILPTLGKQQLVRLVFDSRLYYKERIYRTPYIIPVFRHNELILKQKQLLLLEEKRGFREKAPEGALSGLAIEPLHNLLSFLSKNVA